MTRAPVSRTAADHSGPVAPGEQLLIAALQAWETLRETGQQPQSELLPALSRKTSARSAALIVAWIQAAEAACRRPLCMRCPCCGGISPDAQRLVVSCGVSTVWMSLAEDLLEPLLVDVEAVAVLGRSLNASLAVDGWRLPVRAPCPPPSRVATPLTVH